MSAPQKQCPNCKSVTNLHVLTCFRCGHTFRTRFGPDGKPIRTEPASPPVSAPGFAAPSYTPPPFSNEMDPTISVFHRNAPWIGVVILLLIGYGYGALMNRAYLAQRSAGVSGVQRVTDRTEGAEKAAETHGTP